MTRHTFDRRIKIDGARSGSSVRAFAIGVVFALVGAGCSGSTDAPSTNGDVPGNSSAPTGVAASAAPGPTEVSGVESRPPAVGSGGGGSITVNGETHAVEQVLSCVVDANQKEGSLDLAVISDSGQLQLLIVVEFNDQLVPVKDDGMETKVLQTQNVDLQGPAAGGLWHADASERVIPPVFSPAWTDEDAQPIDGPPLTVAGDQMTGSLTLADFNGGPNTVDIGVDISIPSTPQDCSL